MKIVGIRLNGHGKTYFFDSALILFDDGIGRIDDGLGWTIIALQPEDFRPFEIPFKTQDILHPRPAEGINRLRIISYNINVTMVDA